VKAAYETGGVQLPADRQGIWRSFDHGGRLDCARQLSEAEPFVGESKRSVLIVLNTVVKV
jgi:hypothetical protein